MNCFDYLYLAFFIVITIGLTGVTWRDGRDFPDAFIFWLIGNAMAGLLFVAAQKVAGEKNEGTPVKIQALVDPINDKRSDIWVIYEDGVAQLMKSDQIVENPKYGIPVYNKTKWFGRVVSDEEMTYMRKPVSEIKIEK